MIKLFVKKTMDSLIAFESSFISVEKHTKKRVLILRKDTLGDYILFYPCLYAYRKYYADAEITLVLTDLFTDLLPLLGDFDDVIWFNAKKFSNNFFYRRDFYRTLKKKGFDVAIYATYSRESTGDFMITMTNAKERIGVDGDLVAISETEKKKNNLLYTKLVQVPESVVTEIDKNKYVAETVTGEKININFPTIDYSIFSDEDAQKIIHEYNLVHKKYVVFFPGSGTRFKVWPVAKFAEIADYFISKGITPLVCGSKNEVDIISGILGAMASQGVAIDLSGRTNLPTMVHLLKNAVLYFGSDNGIMHLAAALKVPALSLLGGGHFGRFFPYGDLGKNRIIFDEYMKCKSDNWECSKNLNKGESAPCVRDITVDHVKQEIDSFMLTL